MLEDLDSINWAELHHAYGSAADVPQLLRDLTSSDAEIVKKSLGKLFGNIYHQGSRWEASAYAVPFLIEILNTPQLHGRKEMCRLLFAIALGDGWSNDKNLPFDFEGTFAAADGIVVTEHKDFIRLFYSEYSNLTESETNIALLEKLSVAWARDSFLALQEHAESLLNWIFDSDDTVAKLTLAALPRLSVLYNLLSPLLLKAIASEQTIEYRITAIMTAGLIPVTGTDELKALLQQQVSTATDFSIRLASAISLVLLFGTDIPDSAAETLINAESQSNLRDTWTDLTPYGRSLMGYRALALNRLGL